MENLQLTWENKMEYLAYGFYSNREKFYFGTDSHYGGFKFSNKKGKSYDYSNKFKCYRDLYLNYPKERIMGIIGAIRSIRKEEDNYDKKNEKIIIQLPVDNFFNNDAISLFEEINSNNDWKKLSVITINKDDNEDIKNKIFTNDIIITNSYNLIDMLRNENYFVIDCIEKCHLILYNKATNNISRLTASITDHIDHTISFKGDIEELMLCVEKIRKLIYTGIDNDPQQKEGIYKLMEDLLNINSGSYQLLKTFDYIDSFTNGFLEYKLSKLELSDDYYLKISFKTGGEKLCKNFYSNQWDYYQRELGFSLYSNSLDLYYDESRGSYYGKGIRQKYSKEFFKYRTYRYLLTYLKCEAINTAIADIEILDNEKLIIILPDNNFYEKDAIRIEWKKLAEGESNKYSKGIVPRNINFEINQSIYDCKTIIVPSNRTDIIDTIINIRKENFILLDASTNNKIDCISKFGLLINKLYSNVNANRNYSITLRGSLPHIARSLEAINILIYQGDKKSRINNCVSFSGFKTLTEVLISKNYLACLSVNGVEDIFEKGRIRYMLSDINNSEVGLRVIFSQLDEDDTNNNKEEIINPEEKLKELRNNLIIELEELTYYDKNNYKGRSYLASMIESISNSIK